MVDSNRNHRGQFVAGNQAGRGKRRKANATYLQRTVEKVGTTTWSRIVDKAIEEALAGDHRAREWLGQFPVGRPPQALDLEANEVQLIARLSALLAERQMSLSELVEALLDQLSQSETNENEVAYE